MSVVESAVEQSQRGLCQSGGAHRAVLGLQGPGAAGTRRASGAEGPGQDGSHWRAACGAAASRIHI